MATACVQVEDVCASFWEHRLLITNLWSYYAALNGSLSAVGANRTDCGW